MSEIPPAEQSVNSIVETFHGLAASHAPMEAMVGKILSPPPEIQIAWNNIILTKKQVYIAEYLLAGRRREAKGHIKSATQDRGGGTGMAEFQSHNHDIDNDYTDDIIYTDTLKVGDFVSVLPIKGGQQFIVTDKLIYLGDGYEGAL